MSSSSAAAWLQKRGYSLVSGGTDNHLCLVDLRPKVHRETPPLPRLLRPVRMPQGFPRPHSVLVRRGQGVDGARVETVLEAAHIAANKNTVRTLRLALRPTS